MPIQFSPLPQGYQALAVDASAPCYIITDDQIHIHNTSQLSSEATKALCSAGFSFMPELYCFSAPFSQDNEAFVKKALSVEEPTDEWDPRVSRDRALALKNRLSSVAIAETERLEIRRFISSLVEDGSVIGVPDGPASRNAAPSALNLYRELSACGTKVSVVAMSSLREARPYMGFVKAIWCDGSMVEQNIFVSVVRMQDGEAIIEDVPIIEIIEQENLLDFIIANILKG